MSVSVIERRRIFTHAEGASIVLWLLKRKRWKYKLDTGEEVVDPKNLLICVSIYFYLCGTARRTRTPAGEVSDSELKSQPE